MKLWWLAFQVFFSAITLTVAQAAQVTSQELYKDLKIPLERAYPLSTKINPCEDFYGYVCTEVQNNFTLPSDRSSWHFSFSDNSEKILHAKKKYFSLLQENLTPRTEYGKMLKSYYLSCLNKSARKEEEKEFVKNELESFSKIKTNQQLIEFLIQRSKTGLSSPFDLDNLPSQKDPTWDDAVISVELLSLPEKSYYKKTDLMADYQKAIEVFFKEIGMTDPEKRALDVINFEKKLALVYPEQEVLRERMSKNTYKSSASFKKDYQILFLSELLKDVPEKIKIRDYVPESANYLNQLVKSENLDTLKNVFIFQTLHSYLEKSYPKTFNAFFDLSKKYLGGADKLPPENERCTRKTERAFGTALDFELAPILFPSFDETRMVKLGETVRQTILQGIKQNKWLSDSARKAAQIKIEKAALKLVKPKTEKEWDLIKIQEMNPDKYLSNILKVNQANREKLVAEFKEPRNREKWLMGPLAVNAYYHPMNNEFVLPQGILQHPFFSAKLSDIEILGGVGSVIGHELGHAIDDEGSKYDAIGRLKPWMTAKDLKEFKKRGSQFVERFNKIGHNGLLTLGENIGDHVGLMFSFQTAFPDLNQASKEDLQKFFISLARNECGVMKDSFKELLLKTDPHSMPFARINEQVIHIDGFYKAFQCKPGDKMFVDAKDRIHIW